MAIFTLYFLPGLCSVTSKMHSVKQDVCRKLVRYTALHCDIVGQHLSICSMYIVCLLLFDVFGETGRTVATRLNFSFTVEEVAWRWQELAAAWPHNKVIRDVISMLCFQAWKHKGESGWWRCRSDVRVNIHQIVWFTNTTFETPCWFV